jgi:hypothetical protein
VARLRRESDDGNGPYRAVPFHDYGVEMLGDRQREARVALYSQLLGHLDALATWRRRELGRLFWRLALPGLPDDEPDEPRVADRREELKTAWQALNDCAGRRSRTDREALTEVLFELPWQALLSSPHEVAALIDLDGTANGDDQPSFEDALHAAASAGGHGRTVGEDSPRWKATAQQAGAAAAALPKGSAAARFYMSVEEMARRELDKDRREDDEERQGWQ